jgi:hypothetical protein
MAQAIVTARIFFARLAEVVRFCKEFRRSRAEWSVDGRAIVL